MTGGFITSYPSPAFNTSTLSKGPKKILSSDTGEWIWTPSINIPISFTGLSWFDETNKFWERGILLRILSASNLRFACLCKIKLWIPVVVEPIPTWTVLAEPIWLLEL